MNNNYEGDSISSEYKIFDKQPEKLLVKNISTNEEISKIVNKKKVSKKAISLLLSGVMFITGTTVGMNIDKIKNTADDIVTGITQGSEVDENSIILNDLCERLGKSSEDLYNDYHEYRIKLFEMTGIEEAPTQENMIRFFKNYDSYMEYVGLTEEKNIKKGAL